MKNSACSNQWCEAMNNEVPQSLLSFSYFFFAISFNFFQTTTVRISWPNHSRFVTSGSKEMWSYYKLDLIFFSIKLLFFTGIFFGLGVGVALFGFLFVLMGAALICYAIYVVSDVCVCLSALYYCTHIGKLIWYNTIW